MLAHVWLKHLIDLNCSGSLRRLTAALESALLAKGLKLASHWIGEGVQVIRGPYIICMVAEPAVNNDHGTKSDGYRDLA